MSVHGCVSLMVGYSPRNAFFGFQKDIDMFLSICGKSPEDICTCAAEMCSTAVFNVVAKTQETISPELFSLFLKGGRAYAVLQALKKHPEHAMLVAPSSASSLVDMAHACGDINSYGELANILDFGSHVSQSFVWALWWSNIPDWRSYKSFFQK